MNILNGFACIIKMCNGMVINKSLIVINSYYARHYAIGAACFEYVYKI